jgi:basic membrane lipoprotein Med (substrate-binding protein (PBP1-ABC) superfamily)
MKLWPLLVLALVAGCSGGVREDAAAPTVKDDGVFKVALLTPGSISDAGWNAMAYEGLTAIAEELDCEVANREATDAKIKDAMRSYAQKDFDLVIGHGYEYNEPGVAMAALFPSTVFVSGSGGKTAENAGAFRFYLEQGFYLAGYMAGKMSKTGKVAAVGFNSIPSIKSTFRAFAAGAQAADPDIEVIEPPMGLDDDLAKFKQATLAAIEYGADFVIHQANDRAQGVFDACKERGVYAIGANADQNANESGAVIASAVIIARPAYVELAKQVKEGTYRGDVVLRGMAEGTIDFVVNPTMEPRLPAGLAAELATLKEKIRTGALVVPKDEF